MEAYKDYMRGVLEQQPHLSIVGALVDQLLFEGSRVSGIKTQEGVQYLSTTVIITTGTFLNGLIHRGEERVEAGRIGEEPSKKLTLSLAGQHLRMGRLKTGTPARLDKDTIDWSQTLEQKGDDPIKKFSFWNSSVLLPQVSCYITHTNEKTHQIIAKNLHRSAMYSGAIKGVGPRYCPSIEDKISRFADKNRHQIFLEPTSLKSPMIYPNGLSTSLPTEVQLEMLRSIEGLESVEILQPGYAIEYDFVFPNQLKPSLELKDISHLFMAGQINGTSGYEEAAAQGIMAGINAALKTQGREPLILKRNEAYIGVLIDDLISKGTNEPYRMFTSRSEYRLLLREDNADLRLCAKGYEVGLLSKENYEMMREKQANITSLKTLLGQTRITPTMAINAQFAEFNESPLKTGGSLLEVLKRSQFTIEHLRQFDFSRDTLEGVICSEAVAEQIEIEVKYEGYIHRQEEQVQSLTTLENIQMPEDFPYNKIPGLSREVQEKLMEYRPSTLGQAHRISGITPAAISVLQICLKNQSYRRI